MRVSNFCARTNKPVHYGCTVAQIKKAGVSTVKVQAGAGASSGFKDDAYTASGGTIVNAAEALGADVVLKVSASQQIALRLRTGPATLLRRCRQRYGRRQQRSCRF